MSYCAKIVPPETGYLGWAFWAEGALGVRECVCCAKYVASDDATP